MKKTFLKAAIPTLAMLLVAIMALTGTTYAWFTENNTATANGIDIAVTSAGGLLLSKTGADNTWTSELDLDKEVTGFKATSCDGTLKNGVLDFHTAELADNISFLKANSISASVAQADTMYLKQSIFVKNDKNANVTVNLAGSTIGGEAANAVRVALVIDGALKIFDTTGEATKGLTGEQITVDTALTATGVHVATYTPTPIVNAGSTTFAMAQNTTTELTLYVWLEGQDGQCVNDIALKKFTVGLGFEAN